MNIQHRDIAEGGDLARVYNDQWAGVPFCFPVASEEFQSGLRFRKSADKPDRRLHSRKLLVGEQDGEIVAFADVALTKGRKKREGLIRFLTYRSGSRPVGQALLEEAERYLRDLGITRINAFLNKFSYRFYHLAFGMLSDRMGHIYGLLRMNGYGLRSGEIFMVRSVGDPPEPAPPDDPLEIAIRREPGRGSLPDLTLTATRSGREIGSCSSVSAGEFVRARDAQTSFFTQWLGLEEPEHGKRWGLYLLQRTLWEMRQIGYETAVISTNWQNFRPLLFYTNYGYRVVDTVYEFEKKYEGKKR